MPCHPILTWPADYFPPVHRSDADADVLADYVLALLHNASDGVDIQAVFEEEITPFLKEGIISHCTSDPETLY